MSGESKAAGATPDPQAVQNTDRAIWHSVTADGRSATLLITNAGALAINVGGHVLVKPIESWHKLHEMIDSLMKVNEVANEEIRSLRAGLAKTDVEFDDILNILFRGLQWTGDRQFVSARGMAEVAANTIQKLRRDLQMEQMKHAELLEACLNDKGQDFIERDALNEGSIEHLREKAAKLEDELASVRSKNKTLADRCMVLEKELSNTTASLVASDNTRRMFEDLLKRVVEAYTDTRSTTLVDAIDPVVYDIQKAVGAHGGVPCRRRA